MDDDDLRWLMSKWAEALETVLERHGLGHFAGHIMLSMSKELFLMDVSA